MTNLLLNPDFEQPGTGNELQYQWFPDKALAMPKFDNINPPRHWSAFWREGFPCFGNQDPTGRPEVKHFSKTIDSLRVHTGEYSAQLFTFWRPHDMGLLQRVPAQAGIAYTASVYAHAWYSRCSTEPYSNPLDDDCITFLDWAWCRLAIGICPKGGTDPYSSDIIWGDGQFIYGEYGQELVVFDATAQAAGVTLFIRSVTSHPLKHNDIYLDDAILVAAGGQGGVGGPRVPYDRTYNLISQDATTERATEIFVTGWKKGRQTAGGSADDAMLSPSGMGEVNTVLWDIPMDLRDDYKDFRDEYYPDAHLIFEGKVVPEPPSLPGNHKTLLGLHLQTSIPGYLDYITNARPASVKLVGQFELAREIKAVSPDTIVVARHHVEHQASFLDNPGPRDAAWDFLIQFKDSLRANEQYIDYVEGLNETIGTHDLDGIRKAVAFESAFASVLSSSGIDVKACLLNTAVGNPDHGEETELLLPAVEAAMRYGGAIGYHGYWWADPTDDGLQSWWIHHAGRALESWDITFANHGLRPHYLLTECGAVGTQDGGYSLMPTEGWRSGECIAGNWSRYRNQLLQFDSILASWNAAHDNRVLGAHIFTSGIGVGWHHFQLADAELTSLAEAINA